MVNTKFSALTQIFLITLSLFAFSFAMSDKTIVSAASTATYCCEQTTDGAVCQNAAESSCDASYDMAPTYCESTSYCQTGTCYDSSEGICMGQTPKAVCEEEGMTWDSREMSEIPQCQLGCCVLADQAAFVSLTRCKHLSSLFGVESDYRTDIDDELTCIATAQAEDKGACVYESEYERVCEFTTRAECAAESTENYDESGNILISDEKKFYEGFLCSAEEMATSCARQTSTTCYQGDVYWTDSCGNLENVYSTNLDVSWNDGRVADPDDVCSENGNSNNLDCGNCDYLLGTRCAEHEGFGGPDYGDYYCQDNNCIDREGNERLNGEAWCVVEDENGDNAFDSGGNEYMGDGKDRVGSRYYREYCIDGEIEVESCADYRNEICIEGSVEFDGGEFSTAACRVNKWQDCLLQSDQDDCEDTTSRDCSWVSAPLGLIIGGDLDDYADSDTTTTYNSGVCVPSYPAGLDFWEDGSGDVCSQASARCVVTYEQGFLSATGDWLSALDLPNGILDGASDWGEGYRIARDDDGNEINAECLEEEWALEANRVCAAISDCGGYVNYAGEYTDDGYSWIVPEWNSGAGEADIVGVSTGGWKSAEQHFTPSQENKISNGFQGLIIAAVTGKVISPITGMFTYGSKEYTIYAQEGEIAIVNTANGVVFVENSAGEWGYLSSGEFIVLSADNGNQYTQAAFDNAVSEYGSSGTLPDQYESRFDSTISAASSSTAATNDEEAVLDEETGSSAYVTTTGTETEIAAAAETITLTSAMNTLLEQKESMMGNLDMLSSTQTSTEGATDVVKSDTGYDGGDMLNSGEGSSNSYDGGDLLNDVEVEEDIAEAASKTTKKDDAESGASCERNSDCGDNQKCKKGFCTDKTTFEDVMDWPIVQGLTWAGGAWAATQMVGSALGFEQSTTDSLSLSLAAGFGTAKWLETAKWTQEGESLEWLGEHSTGAGVVTGLVVLALTYKDQTEQVITFECLPWQPPVGGDNCELCNDGDLPCSEYKCKSLGTACEIVNAGTTEEKCVNVDPQDTNPPVITPQEYFLTDGYEYTNVEQNPPSPGFEIVSSTSSDGCIPAFTPIEFGVTLNEPAQCKISLESTESYDEMESYFGGSNLYAYNHTEYLSLPSAEDLEDSGVTIENGKDLTLFMRCQDKNGNTNDAEYAIKLCVDPSPDTTSPVIEATSIATDSCVAEDESSATVKFYTNEPSDCKWDREDRDYDSMAYEMEDCGDYEGLLYSCTTDLTGIDRDGTTFYVRCQDWANEETGANTMTSSYELSLHGSTGLLLMDLQPNETETIYGAVSPMQVTLTVETAMGCSNGIATCAYSTEYSETGSGYTAFYDTYNEDGIHTQDLYLDEGSHDIYIRCVDDGGNLVEDSTEINLEIDEDAPMITRVYEDSGYLKIITLRDSECSYTYNDCDFTFDEGTIMPYSNDTIHVAEWSEDKTFYIKCRDEFNNIDDDCSIVVRPTANFF